MTPVSYTHLDVYKRQLLTMAEEAQFHYNGNKMVKAVMSFMMYIIEVVWLGNHINGGATYLSYVTGMDLTTSKLVAVLAFGIYVIIGGYLAVVWTDLDVYKRQALRRPTRILCWPAPA